MKFQVLPYLYSWDHVKEIMHNKGFVWATEVLRTVVD